VIVSIDHAPHDSDQDPEVVAYEFQGPDAADRFHRMATALAEESEAAILVYPPQPLQYAHDAWDAFGNLGIKVTGGL
jgi:hypothetical protein